MNLPCGEDVSIGSMSERKKAFLASSRSITSRRCESDRARRSMRTTTSVSPLPIRSSTRASTGRARFPPEACSSWISRSRRISGPATGAGGLILRRDARIADQGHQNRPFAVSDSANKRPFENRCKGTLCGADRWNPLGFHALNATRALSTDTARAYYKRSKCSLTENPWVVCTIGVFCTYAALPLCSA